MYYVTLFSIIQASALGYLLLVVKDQLVSIINSTYEPLWTILIIATFLMIIAIWINYTFPAPAFRRLNTTLDALIPFCFGVAQALAIFSISLQQLAWYYFSFSLLALVGLAQCRNTFREARLDLDIEQNRIV